jgi:hypothetical protein
MTNFSTNQVMQFYVHDSAKGIELTPNEKLANGGFSIAVDNNGEVSATDIIENVEYASYTAAADMNVKTKKATVTLTVTEDMKGNDFVLRVKYPEIGGVGVEGWTVKTVAVRGTAASTVATELAKLLNASLKVDGMLKATASGSTVVVEVIDNKKYYKRGVRPLVAVDFTVEVNKVVVEGEEKDWASVAYAEGSVVIPAIYKIADLEYFAMGERADQYRNIDYINAIDTDYKVDVASTYDLINIHYSYKGCNQNSHKSEKDLFIAGPASQLKALAGLLKTAGVEIAGVPA